MTVDISKIKPGDEVTVRVKVVTASFDRLGVCSVACTDPVEVRIWIFDNEIHSHTPKAPEVGDRVRGVRVGSRCRGTIIATAGDQAWVQWEPDAFNAIERRETWTLDDLERDQ